MKQRALRAYDKEFKLNAIKLYISSDEKYGEVSKRLGIPTTTLIGWVFKHKREGKEGFVGKGNIAETDREMVQLRKRLAIAEEERDILKKALGIFSLRQK
jgi:transposase-like protein